MQKNKIIIVEDEPIIGMELQDTLEMAGYEIAALTDSADTLLQLVQDEKPDLLLMDIRLRSYLDGIDAVQRLRLFSDIPVIYITAWTTQDVRLRADTTKPEAFLTKPIDSDELLAEISRILDKSKP